MDISFNTAVTKTIDVAGTSFAYREFGQAGGVPLVFLHHLTAVLEDWDPAIVDGPLRAPLSARTPLSRGPDPVVADLSERKCFGSPKFGA
jgi:pimeloyl-ACP methyl ester carboxylesterase